VTQGPKTLSTGGRVDRALSEAPLTARKVPKEEEDEPTAKVVPLPKGAIEPVKPSRPPPPPRTFKDSLKTFVNSLVLTLIILYLLNTDFRNALAGGADAVFRPLIGFDGTLLIATLLAAGVITSSISTALAHVFTDYIKQARMAEQNRALQKLSFEAMRAKNPKKVEKVAEMRKKAQGDNVGQMWAPLKMMGYSLLIIGVIFVWMGQFVFSSAGTPETAGRMFFAVPWSWRVSLVEASVLPHYILLYSLLAIPVGSVMRRLLRYFTFKKRLAAIASREAAGSA